MPLHWAIRIRNTPCSLSAPYGWNTPWSRYTHRAGSGIKARCWNSTALSVQLPLWSLGGHLCRPYIALHCRVSMLLLLLAAVKTYFKTQVWQDEVRTHSVRRLHSSWQCIVCRWVISLLLSIYVVGGYLVRSCVFTILIKCIKGHKSLGSLCCCGFKHCQRHNGPRNWLRDLD